MTRVITGDFDSIYKMRNAMDDLIASGIDREKVYMDKPRMQLKVLVPISISQQVNDVVARHEPVSLTCAPPGGVPTRPVDSLVSASSPALPAGS
jgi:hypothetical protein